MGWKRRGQCYGELIIFKFDSPLRVLSTFIAYKEKKL